MSLNVRFSSVVWGFTWAAILQFTPWGRWLSARRTWITVVIGGGVDLLILSRVLPRPQWWHVFEVLSLSAIGIVLRALIQEYRDTNDAG